MVEKKSFQNTKKPEKQEEPIKKLFDKKNLYLLGIIALVFVIILALTLVYLVFINSDELVEQSAQNVNLDIAIETIEEEGEIKYVRALDGVVVVDEDQANPRIVSVMIEDLYQARPQSGLASAPLVYATLAEGGITRFIAFFNGDEELAKIGPVRSARPYYLEWVSEFDALYAHCGGSPNALAAIDGLGINDLNQMYSYKYFWRDTGRYAPHNLYTSSELLNTALRDNGITESEIYRPWKFKDDEPDQSINNVSIYVDYSVGETYDAEYLYNANNNDYVRYQLGSPQQDTNSGDIRVKNVAIIRIPAEDYETEKGRLILDISGTGEAWVFRDGLKIHGIWQKEDRTSRTLFYNEEGNEIEFNRGNTWVEVVPGERGISYYE